MHTRFHILPSLLLLLLAGAPAFGQELEKPTVFGSASLQLPKGWVVVKAAGSEGLSAKSPQVDKDDASSDSSQKNGFSASISVHVKPVTGEVDTAAILKTMEGSLNKYRRVEEPTPIMIGEAKGITFGGTFVTMGLPVRTRVYVVTISDKLYVIGFSALASRWAGYQPVIEASVKTFAVKK